VLIAFLFLFIRWGKLVRTPEGVPLILLAITLVVTYSFMNGLLRDFTIAGIPVGRQRYLIPFHAIMFLLGVNVIIGSKNLLGYIQKNIAWEKSSIAASLFLFFFFLYGHVFNLFFLDAGKGYKFLFKQYEELFFIMGTLLILGMAFVLFLKQVKELNRQINLITLFLIGMTIIQITYHLSIQFNNELDSTRTPITLQNLPDTAARDVYFIVVDAYSRADVQKKYLGMDISDFEQELEAIGFAVAKCSNSNYPETYMSMSATLNMDYLEKLDLPAGKKKCIFKDCLTKSDLQPFIKRSLVRQKFEEMGYSTVTFKIVNPYLDISDADYYFDFSKDTSVINKTETVFFYYLFLKTTALRPYLDYLEWQGILKPNAKPMAHEWLPVGTAFSDRNYNQYKLTLYNLQSLENVYNLPGKKFVYAHLIITHEPFVFTPDGKFRYPITADAKAYRDQVQFANNRLLEIIKTIIKKSPTKPIIILQSDHGWVWGDQRNNNLSAFYMPDSDNNIIYPEISNVNTFRIIFNEYFGTNYELLPDTTYYYSNTDITSAPSVCP